MNINDTRYPAKWYAGRSPCENFVYEIAAIVENRVTKSNRNTILHGIIKQKQLRKHQMYIMNAPTTGHRRPRTIAMFLFFFSPAKSRNFCDINRRSTRMDNFVTGVKMFPYMWPCCATCVPIGKCYICTACPTIYSSLCRTQYSVYEQRENFVTVHCVCLITTPLKYMTLYFKIQHRPI